MHLRTRTRTGLFLVAILAAACAGQNALAAHGELSRSIDAGTRALTAEISFSTDFEVKTFELDNPPRFVVDMEPALLPNGGVPGGVGQRRGSRSRKPSRLQWATKRSSWARCSTAVRLPATAPGPFP